MKKEQFCVEKEQFHEKNVPWGKGIVPSKKISSTNKKNSYTQNKNSSFRKNVFKNSTFSKKELFFSPKQNCSFQKKDLIIIIIEWFHTNDMELFFPNCLHEPNLHVPAFILITAIQFFQVYSKLYFNNKSRVSSALYITHVIHV